MLGFAIVSCEDTLPKPNAMLRLEYPTAKYETYYKDGCGYVFDKNDYSYVKEKNGCSVDLVYPEMKGTIYLSYRTVNGDIKKILTDVQKLTYEHVVKADNIIEQPYVNPEKRKFGMFYEVDGNAASQSQFYLTDSVSHFIMGSIYFDSRPNYDSILPAAVYLKDDVRRIMESLEWR
ncbi:gliding motility lipoprotein GldD [Neptunitalea chrysea]|uniref:Gliding motility lipoprotein GldD n=2 Tax=Neptunitalea chrysea TaxID=1647581 RepID=A0A9W6EWX9_9FLAO|nr:gliding motility lipoprotein GldD [Neptunitalea chrysea]